MSIFAIMTNRDGNATIAKVDDLDSWLRDDILEGGDIDPKYTSEFLPELPDGKYIDGWMENKIILIEGEIIHITSQTLRNVLERSKLQPKPEIP